MSATTASTQAQMQKCGGIPAAARKPYLSASVRMVRSLTLAGPAGQIEAVWNAGLPDARFAALVCPPHPLHGGNLHNKVVYRAMKALNDPAWGLGLPVLRINFRGVGRSQGEHDGLAETGDVLAALEWLRREFALPLVAVGFSFGAAMVLRTASQATAMRGDLRALAALGLPTDLAGPAYNYPFLHTLSTPKLFLSGDRDAFSSAVQLHEVAASAAEPKRMILIPGADHFFTDRLERMQQELAGWLKEHLA